MDDDCHCPFDFDEYACEQEKWSNNFIEEKKKCKKDGDEPNDSVVPAVNVSFTGTSVIAFAVIAFMLLVRPKTSTMQ